MMYATKTPINLWYQYPWLVTSSPSLCNPPYAHYSGVIAPASFSKFVNGVVTKKGLWDKKSIPSISNAKDYVKWSSKALVAEYVWWNGNGILPAIEDKLIMADFYFLAFIIGKIFLVRNTMGKILIVSIEVISVSLYFSKGFF